MTDIFQPRARATSFLSLPKPTSAQQSLPPTGKSDSIFHVLVKFTTVFLVNSMFLDLNGFDADAHLKLSFYNGSHHIKKLLQSTQLPLRLIFKNLWFFAAILTIFGKCLGTPVTDKFC